MVSKEYLADLLKLDEGELEAYELFKAWDAENRTFVDDGGVPSVRPHGKKIDVSSMLEESMIFPKGYDVHVTKHPRYFDSVLHCHNFFEVIYVAEGRCRQLIDGREFVLNAGDLCILPPGVMHAPEAFGLRDLALNIQVRQSTFRAVFSGLLESGDLLSDFFMQTVYGDSVGRFLIFCTGDDEVILETVLTMYQEVQLNSPYANSFLRAYTELFFAAIMRWYRDTVEIFSTKDERNNKIFVPMLHYVERNLASVDLSALAREFHYSQSQISRMFREYTGSSFSDTLRSQRLIKAGELLKSSNLTVEQVAEAVGYMSASEFYRAFRKKYGTTPAAYRGKK